MSKQQNTPPLSKRVVATLIDYGICIVVLFFYVSYFGHDSSTGKKVTGEATLPLLLFWLGYFVFMETFMNGTLGHLALGLRVISEYGDKIEFTQALKRRIADVLDLHFFGLVAVIVIQNNEKGQRLGDMWAKTLVVETEKEQG